MINTNGFKNEYIDTCKEQLLLQSEYDEVSKGLSEYYVELEALNEKYRSSETKKKLTGIFTKIKDIDSRKEYFYFRSIVDGIYNLLKEYGWQFELNLFKHLKHMFAISSSFDEGFNTFYLEEICDMSTATVLHKRYMSGQRTTIIHEDDNGFNHIQIPEDCDIDLVLNEAESHLKVLKVLDDKKKQDEEYETYLRLKEKYEGEE